MKTIKQIGIKQLINHIKNQEIEGQVYLLKGEPKSTIKIAVDVIKNDYKNLTTLEELVRFKMKHNEWSKEEALEDVLATFLKFPY